MNPIVLLAPSLNIDVDDDVDDWRERKLNKYRRSIESAKKDENLFYDKTTKTMEDAGGKIDEEILPMTSNNVLRCRQTTAVEE